MPPPSFQRERYFEDTEEARSRAAPERALLRLLLSSDGSTTRNCEAIAGTPPEIVVGRQVITKEVPAAVRRILHGDAFIERFSCLAARGQVMTDNLVYVARDALPRELRGAFDSCTVPVGHLLDTLWIRREPVPAEQAVPLHERLWAEVGLPDSKATRAYTITTPEGPLFIIVETFRRGMRMAPVTESAEVAVLR